MIINIHPSQANGTVMAPPSKSMAHRLLICAGLAKGQSIIHNVVLSEDIAATLDCLCALGASWEIYQNKVIISGTDLKSPIQDNNLNCRESGSTLRFILPLALAQGSKINLLGSKRLLERPLDLYQKIADANNFLFDHQKEQVTVKGPLTPGDYIIPGNVSSQFITGLLYTLPLLQGDSTLTVTPPIESMSYINMTLQALREFGIEINVKNNTVVAPEFEQEKDFYLLEQNMSDQEIVFLINGEQEYLAAEKTVEGDFSNAAFLEAFNLFGGNVKLKGLDLNSAQGDKVYSNLFKQLKLGKAQISLKDCPDLGPILFAISAALNGGIFTETKRLAIKESDRAQAMADELAKFGIQTLIRKNLVEIRADNFQKPEQNLCGHNDHRIVMSLAVLASLTGAVIEGAAAVNKSFPDFFQVIEKLGIKFERLDRSKNNQ